MLMKNTDIDELIQSTQKKLLQTYISDHRPWVIAYSGGKDSTLVLQLVYEMLIELRRTSYSPLKPVYVITSDTGVEPPNIALYLSDNLNKISKHASLDQIPMHVSLVKPDPGNSFWSNLIGRGYPSPTRWFRWCTRKMKVVPSRVEIDKISSQYGSVILLIGSRLDESSSRKQSMDTRLKNSKGMNPHHEIPNALVFTPIAEWEKNDVWKFLSNYPPPWGGSHDFMLDIYRQAGGSECLFALDLQTPSCGGSRFGCWTCTVVREDKSMKGFIQTGEEWMEPLNIFRNWLKEIREDMRMRLPYRRNKSKGPGPFSPEARKQILMKLLETERVVGIPLISDKELSFIQRQWTEDFDTVNSAFKIAAKFKRTFQDMPYNFLEANEEDNEKAIIQKLVAEFEIEETCVVELLDLVKARYPTLDQHGNKERLKQDIKRIIEKAIEQEELAEL